MTELDHVWSEMLKDAALKAIDSGRQDLVDYLRLKAANDTIRTAGVAWLIDTFIEIAAYETRKNIAITIERQEPHNFAHGNSNMVGRLLNIRYGVRCLTVEAGWTRTPTDGVMRNGALAFARISHFGLPRFAEELRLVRGNELPNWIDKTDAVIDSGSLRRHFEVFLDK